MYPLRKVIEYHLRPRIARHQIGKPGLGDICEQCEYAVCCDQVFMRLPYVPFNTIHN